MAIPSRQIGWGTEDNLLWQISKQLEQLTNVTAQACTTTTTTTTLPVYRVYTALLTQSGGDSSQQLYSGAVTKGVTYKIKETTTGDFSNVGAPNNNVNTIFVATNNEVPNNYSGGNLTYNAGAPVATVLENTIGNIWFTYDGVGSYSVYSNSLFTIGKTFSSIYSQLIDTFGDGVQFALIQYKSTDINNMGIQTGRAELSNFDDYLFNTPIEIRVYN
jgi:hypothetical protein